MYQSFPIGVNVFVIKDGQLLLGKRKNVYGAGTWGLPGGHLENNESMEEAAARELKEETGLTAKRFEFVNLVNDRRPEQHRIQVGFAAHEVNGSLAVCEPDKCEKWEWFDFDTLPAEILPGHVHQIKIFQQRLSFLDN